MVKLGWGPLSPEPLSQSLESVTLHRIPGRVRIGVQPDPRSWEVEGIKVWVGHSDPVRASGPQCCHRGACKRCDTRSHLDCSLVYA